MQNIDQQPKKLYIHFRNPQHYKIDPARQTKIPINVFMKLLVSCQFLKKKSDKPRVTNLTLRTQVEPNKEGEKTAP